MLHGFRVSEFVRHPLFYCAVISLAA